MTWSSGDGRIDGRVDRDASGGRVDRDASGGRVDRDASGGRVDRDASGERVDRDAEAETMTDFLDVQIGGRRLTISCAAADRDAAAACAAALDARLRALRAAAASFDRLSASAMLVIDVDGSAGRFSFDVMTPGLGAPPPTPQPEPKAPAGRPGGVIHKAVARRLSEDAGASDPPPATPAGPSTPQTPSADAGRVADAALAKVMARADDDRARRRRGPPMPRGTMERPAVIREPTRSAPPPQADAAPVPATLAPMGEDDGAHDERDGLAIKTLGRVREASRAAHLRALMAKAPKADGLDKAGVEGWRMTPQAFRGGPPQAITHIPAGARDATDDVGYYAYGGLKAPILTVPDKIVVDEDDARSWFHAALVHRATALGMTLPRPVRIAYGLPAA